MIARDRRMRHRIVARRHSAGMLGAAASPSVIRAIGVLTAIALTALVPAANVSAAAPVAAATPAQQDPELARSPIYTWLEENRTAAFWAAPLLMVVVAILPVPAEIPAAMNGMLFGAVLGTLVTWSGAMIGAMISYELARCFGRKLSYRFLRPEALRKLESLQNTEAAVLLMLRLTPVVAFTVVNWAAGLFQVRRSTFVWTTAVGIVPGAVAFTASGSFMAVLYERYPGSVTAVVGVLCAALLARVWWKQRASAEPTA